MKKPKQLIDRVEVYRRACAGCTRHGEAPMECNHDEPCERLISEFTNVITALMMVRMTLNCCRTTAPNVVLV